MATTFEQVYAQLVSLADSHPQRTTRHHYTKNGEPFDLVGSALAGVGVPVSVLESVNDKLFVLAYGVLLDSLDTSESERYLLSALLSRVQVNQDKGSSWQSSLTAAVRSFRRWAVNPVSGFLVQTSDKQAPAILARALAVTS